MAIHPAGIKNSHTSQLVFWTLFLPLLTLIFLPLFHVSPDIDPAEIEMVQRAGVQIDAVSEKTQDQFKRWFIDTGAMQVSTGFFQGSGDYTGRTQLVSNLSAMASDWMRSVWGLIYKYLWRLHALAYVYVAAITAVCLPALVDGICVRARKRYQFQASNPLVFNVSTHTAVMVIGLLVYIPLIPFALTPVPVAAFMGFLGLALWWAAANFQTGV
ncbi:DUF4400 domain-containing protein [Noviherbaspirillum pedocola]|uniref:DUF4400 domain-containing protein n=1 Tax=Noviherbaspirillum pedocola TaxID=2801341 RepID=A0A934SV72_9BURK|nr:DUF4400 domain-containing protein [Noviherbaspirillum pedocola]MBK4736025.1 DUF4400 domain-containing protein [Noviherbaspirillum pedocola]